MGVMMSLSGVCKVPNTDLPDDQLRQSIVVLSNGKYATMICRGCGIYHVDPDGNYKTAKIVSTCKACFEPR